MEENHSELSGSLFSSFPRGCCGNTSDMLARWLNEKGCVGIKSVSGKRPLARHAWLEINEIIVDITSDQFSDGLSPVYIGRNRDFHDLFINQTIREPSISKSLLNIYLKFQELMDAS